MKSQEQEQGQEQGQTENKSPEQGNKNPKIYRVIYDGNGNTEGEVPVDDNLYAEGDTVYIRAVTAPDYGLRKNGMFGIGWDVEGAAAVNPWNIDYGNGKYGFSSTSNVTFGKSDILITAFWEFPKL